MVFLVTLEVKISGATVGGGGVEEFYGDGLEEKMVSTFHQNWNSSFFVSSL